MAKNLVFMPECHSTNTLALDLCQQSYAPEGTLVITNNQTSGRGQRGNSWEAQPGMNLTFSVIIKPTFLALKDQFFLSMVTSLAIYDYIFRNGQAAAAIKWPNDILVNERKICGVLIETQVTGNQFSSAVIGVGLNVNQQQFSSPAATSLSLESNAVFDLGVVLEKLLSHLESRYLQLRGGHYQELKEDYLRHLYRLNEPRTFRSAKEEFTGTILGVDENGMLRVMTGEEEKRFGVKEISFVDQ